MENAKEIEKEAQQILYDFKLDDKENDRDIEKILEGIKTREKELEKLLKETQNEMKVVVQKLKDFKEFPDLPLEGELEETDKIYKTLCAEKKKYEALRVENEKYLAEIFDNRAKVEEPTKNQIEYKKKQKETYDKMVQDAKALSEKIYRGTANNLERDEYTDLTERAIPELEEQLNIKNNFKEMFLDNFNNALSFKNGELAKEKTTVEMPDNEASVGDATITEIPVDEMTIDEMNTILNMSVGGNIDKNFFDKTAKRLGVPIGDLIDIANEKEQKLKEKEEKQNAAIGSTDTNIEKTEEKSEKVSEKETSEKEAVEVIVEPKVESKVGEPSDYDEYVERGGLVQEARKMVTKIKTAFANLINKLTVKRQESNLSKDDILLLAEKKQGSNLSKESILQLVGVKPVSQSNNDISDAMNNIDNSQMIENNQFVLQQNERNRYERGLL